MILVVQRHFELVEEFFGQTTDIDKSLSRRSNVRRAAKLYTVKDNRLYYIGANGLEMRLVVMSNEEKERVLRECHDNPAIGGHQGRKRTQKKVKSAYYWSTITRDTKQWVEECPKCQMNDTIKTEAPVLHPIAVSEPWSVLGMDLIEPLPTTPSGYKYALTMTDLFTKWVIAEPLRNKSAADVATAVVNKLFDFGLVDKIITDQGREFVNEVNKGIFNTLGVKQCISSAYHPQTNGQDERTNQTLKRALAKYTNETHNDWDSHLKAVVYAINTSEQSSTRYTPYFSMFCRHPKMPEVLNSSPIGEDFVIGDVAENMDNRIEQVKALHAECLQRNLLEGTIKSDRMYQWLHPSGSSRMRQLSKPKRFHPAVAQHCEELVGKIGKIAQQVDKDIDVEEFVFEVMIPEVTIQILQKHEGFSRFWAEMSFAVECINI
ncbi:hypothetical protein MATL_G00192640 [Megalops atlanticus]|uniref:Gypsy retrotransposon integrase-like protein 1 n=1 Tax=Megalops atlanticus TaxID=7932 RepID=A0A9D3PKW4_MEGAT|nr:hypothetical protein MATL_G00192640 [Megalops atlanticus]